MTPEDTLKLKSDNARFLWHPIKGISSGYVPLGATAMSAKVVEVSQSDASGAGQISHGYTYSAHPVAAAAAVETLKILQEEKIPEHVARVAERLQTRLRKLEPKHSFVGDVRGHGLMLCVEMVQDKTSRTTLAKTNDTASRVAKACYRRGLMVRISGPNLILSPPLIISNEEIDNLCEVMEASFAEVQASL
jgi:putrescine---pyruvate transaminase